MKRLFIEGAFAQDVSDMLETNFRSAVILFGLDRKKYTEPKHLFDQIIYGAGGKIDKVWTAIKKSDEIFVSTALMPTNGYNGNLTSPELFNEMMRLSIAEKVTGKKIYIFRDYRSVKWQQLNADYVAKCFKENELYTSDSTYLVWKRVNINELLEFDMGVDVLPELPIKSKSTKKKK
jgi:hypothetical protein